MSAQALIDEYFQWHECSKMMHGMFMDRYIMLWSGRILEHVIFIHGDTMHGGILEQVIFIHGDTMWFQQ